MFLYRFYYIKIKIILFIFFSIINPTILSKKERSRLRKLAFNLYKSLDYSLVIYLNSILEVTTL